MHLNPVKTIVRIVVLSASGNVLLMQRAANDKMGALEWEVPGGSVEEGEDFAASGSRELLEEAGLKVADGDLQLVHTYSGDFGNGQRCLLFFALKVDTELAVRLSHEHEDYQWIQLGEATKRKLFQHHQEALQYIQQNVLA